MVEVKIKELKYIKDIPVEMLQQAVDAGEIRKGNTLGLMVRPVEVVTNEDVLIELKLSEDLQSELIGVGSIIPIESYGNICLFSPEWRYYLEGMHQEEKTRLKNITVVVHKEPQRTKLSASSSCAD